MESSELMRQMDVIKQQLYQAETKLKDLEFEADKLRRENAHLTTL